MTDHKAEAEKSIEVVTRCFSVGVLPAATVFAMAQVHATLALADATRAQTEQLRIGNLIAYKQLRTPHEVDVRGLFRELPVNRDDMTDDIERGLGWAL